ncbi:MAG: hypothetical protein QOE05_321, partial [Actinomycetota bacterium]|nr:hypothetical protein [Actinomycetota bacterium]
MTVTMERPADGAAEPSAAAAGPDHEGVGPPDLQDADDAATETTPVLRIGICILFPVLAAAVTVGGIFSGASARPYAGTAGALGIALAGAVAKLRRPVLVNALVVAGMFAIGLVLLVPSGLDSIVSLRQVVAEARAHGNVLRPPVPLEPGWIAIVGWLMGILGFTAGWIAFVLRKPALALVLPLPIAGIAAISVPKSAQVASGIAVLALFAVGLGLLSGAQAFGQDDERPPVSYEIRRALRSIPLVGLITVLMYLVSQANFLFPSPVIDPTHQPQKPKTVPLSKVEDRVLFEVRSSITGPWRIGSLDVYDGHDWRLPPFSDSKLGRVPRDGIVDRDLQ